MSKTGGCSPLSISFTNLSTAPATASFTWDFGNGNSSALKNPSAIYLEEKTYSVTLTVTDGTQKASRTKTITVYKKPVVDFTVARPKVCLPEGVPFTSVSSAGDGTITNYQWDFGDGITQQGFGAGMFHNYNKEIIPAVSLTITNSHGCVTSTTKTNIVEVLPKIEPKFTINKTMLCDLGDTIKLTNTSTGPGTLQYLWEFGDGTTSNQKDPWHQYTKKGVYQVRLTVSNTVGCSVTSSSVSVNAAFFQTNFTSQQLCRQGNFNGSAFLFPTASLWQFGNGATATGYPATSYTYPTPGTYDVTLINTYNNTCKDTIKKTINVQSTGSFNTDITVPAAVCKGSTATFTSTSSVVASFRHWNFGDGTTFSASSNSITHIYNQPGTYTVTLANTFGTCTETVSKTIVVNNVPSTNGFVADFGGVCGAPVTVTFRDTTPGAVGWQWSLDWSFNTPFSTLQNAPQPFLSDGLRTVHLTVTNAAGCARTVWKTINISRPSASIIITQSSSPRNYYDCDSLTLRLAVNSNQPIQSYSWDFGNGNTSTLPNPQVHYDKVGVYNIVLNYVTESGCFGTTSFSARVYGKPDADFAYRVPCGNSFNLSFTDVSAFSDSWQWNFGDGGSAFWINPDHQYPDTGRYTVRFINTIGRCSDTIVKHVYANLLPSSVAISKAENTCDGNRGTVTFDQSSLRCSGGTWDFGDGAIIPYDSSNHSIKHTYTATGSYQVKLTSSYGSCNYTAMRNVNVLLKQNPVLTGTSTEVCANNSLNVHINGLPTNPFSPTMFWSQYSLAKFEHNNGIPFNGSVFSSGFQPTSYTGTLQNFTAGTTALRAIVTEAVTGCQDTSNFITLQVNGPVAGFRIVNNNSCYKSSFVFEDTSRSATNVALTTWRWELGDGTIITNTTNASITHRYNNPGNYFVRLTVTDAAGCSKTVTASANARGPKAAFTTSGLFVPNVPLNTTVSFFNNSFSSNSTVGYTWHYGEGSTSTNFSGSHTYTVPGTYTVMLIASDPSIPCADTARQVITVKDFNTAFSYTKTFLSANTCPPVLVRINNLSIGFTRLLWDFGDGTTSTQTFPSHTYHTPGRYRITLYTYGFNGLSGTYVDSIEVSKPSARLTADILQGCTSQQVALGLTAQNSVNYLWDMGDGSTSTAAAGITHAYLSPGIYNPRIIVKDSNNCQAPAQLADTIVIDSLAIAIKGIPALVCDSALIHFTPDVKSFAEARLGTTLQYKWDFGTGNPADTSNIKNASFRYTTPGTYLVTCKVVSPYGCVKQTTATVVVHQKAKAAITAVTESCEQLTVQFTGAATPSAGVQWSWNFDNGNTSTQQNPSPQLYATPGNYTVTLLVTKDGCADTVKHQLAVYARPVINAQPREKVLCLGDSVLLSANGGGNYLWTPATGLSNSAIANPVAKPATSIQYKVRVVSDKGCINRDSINITVAQPINVTVSGNADLCRGLSNQLRASGATSYQWINNVAGLTNPGVANPSASPNTTTTYTVVGYDNYSCFTDTASLTIAVHDLPTVSAGPDVEVAGGTPHQLNTVSSSDVTGWLWSPGQYLSCVDCATPIATPKMETAYTVKVANRWGCVGQDTVIVKLICAMGHVRIPDAFTPNNDGKNDVFYISGSGVKIIRYLRIYDRWGGLAFEKREFGIDDRSSAWDGRVNGQPVAGGSYVYVAELECSSGERFVRKGTVTVVR
ncbi:MAG TPA: PKD domain-containing protein [Flavisolibacter sp.]|nr:PKD domain-containing protein [Flavisolibacter sp.]